MKYLKLEEIQQAEKNILKETIAFLTKNNIPYAMCGGTLLGAVRHQGFIPWDDDIDIFVPRPDYEKLISLLKKNQRVAGYKATGSMLKNSYHPFIKITNEKILTYNDRMDNNKQMNLWIDIFPIDGLPKEKEKTEKLYQKVKYVRNLYMLKTYKYGYLLKTNNIIKGIVKGIVKTFLVLLPYSILSKRLDDLSKTYSYEEEEYVGGVLWGYGPKEKMPKKDVLWKEFDFCDLKVMGLKNYHQYLTNLYGDYMKLPPEEKRKTHEFIAWRNER